MHTKIKVPQNKMDMESQNVSDLQTGVFYRARLNCLLGATWEHAKQHGASTCSVEGEFPVGAKMRLRAPPKGPHSSDLVESGPMELRVALEGGCQLRIFT